MRVFLILTCSWMIITVFGNLYSIGVKHSKGLNIGNNVLTVIINSLVFCWASYLLIELK